MRSRVFGVFAVALFSLTALACSSDDDEEEGGPYDGVVEWRCFEGSDCWCVGLGPGDDADSSDPQVTSCSFSVCFVYHPFPESDSWHCSCGPDGFTLDQDATDPMPIAACPPE